MNATVNWPWWVVLALACVVGYLVVAKIIDFFRKESAWDASPPSSDEESELIGGHDPKKPTG